jgi:hypothetical protein
VLVVRYELEMVLDETDPLERQEIQEHKYQ